jgi:hypothetical protein
MRLCKRSAYSAARCRAESCSQIPKLMRDYAARHVELNQRKRAAFLNLGRQAYCPSRKWRIIESFQYFAGIDWRNAKWRNAGEKICENKLCIGD